MTANSAKTFSYILPKPENVAKPSVSYKLSKGPPRIYRCRECPEVFNAFRSLKVHEETDHMEINSNSSICNYCCSLYANAESLEKHKEECHTDKKFICQPCQKRYSSKGYLYKHTVQTHNSESLLYYCTLCPNTYKFGSRGILQKHFQDMHMLMPTMGDFDVDIATDVEFLDEFLLRETELLDYWDIGDLSDILHIPGNGGTDHKDGDTTGAYKCPKCSVNCSSLRILLHHLAGVHSLDMLCCNRCDAKFNKYTKFREHCRWQCPKNDKIVKEAIINTAPIDDTTAKAIKCPYCQKTLVGTLSFKRHVRTVHSAVKKHICQLCDRLFSTLDHLKKHVLSRHENERKHICHICSKGFTQLCHLKQHIEIHQNTKRFVCDLCASKFYKKVELKRHINETHSK